MGLTSIEWTGKTWNPIKARTREALLVPTKRDPLRVIPAGKVGYHCEHVSPGCKNCYAEAMNHRTLPAWGTGLDYTVPNRGNVEIFLDENVLREPLSWKRPTKIFPCSMTDWVADFVDGDTIDRMLAVAALTPRHTYQFLTKRADRLARHILERHRANCSSCVEVFDIGTGNVRSASWINPLPNVHVGFSAEDQPNFDAHWERMRKLAAAGWFTWCSYEPALGPLNARGAMMEGVDPGLCANCGGGHGFTRCPNYGRVAREKGADGRTPACSNFKRQNFGLGWVVIGGESGSSARPFDLQWARDLIKQGKETGVPVFLKQLGALPLKARMPHPDDAFLRLNNRKGGDWLEWPEDLRVREFPEVRQ